MINNIFDKSNRLGFLDVLRGFAAIYVVFFHTIFVNSPALSTPAFIAPIFNNGWSGVTLFFIVSAFTLCYTLNGKQDAPQATLKFYIRRVFRIVPLYYLWIFAMLIIDSWYINLPKRVFLAYFLFGYNFLPGRQEGLVWASWTLGIEMVFYFIFPFIFRIIQNLKSAVVFLTVTLIISFIHYQFFTAKALKGYIINMSIASQLPVFAIGIITFYIYSYLKKTQKLHNSSITLILGITLFFALPYLFDYTQAGFFVKTYSMSIVYALILLGMSLREFSIYSNRFIIFLGVISYSLYLNHPQLIRAFKPAYIYVYELGLPNSISIIISFLITFIPLLLLSYLTFRFIETPGMALGKKIISKLPKKE